MYRGPARSSRPASSFNRSCSNKGGAKGGEDGDEFTAYSHNNYGHNNNWTTREREWEVESQQKEQRQR